MSQPARRTVPTEVSPRLKARIAGALYLIIIAGGLFAEAFVRQRVIVYGDAAATARNILAHEQPYRLGFAVGIVYLLCNLPLTLIFYELFKVVNRTLALLLASFRASLRSCRWHSGSS